VRKHPVVRAVLAVVAALAAAVSLGLVLIEPTRSRPAGQRTAEEAGTVTPRGPARPKTIVMVVFDELPLTSLMGRGGRIDAERYPAFAELARDATWYRGATAVHDSTGLAVPAILSGRYPRAGARPDVYSHPANLFTLLERRYHVNASEEATGLCPTSLCEPEPGTTGSRLSGGRPVRFRAFVRSVERAPRPTLWFKHLLLPHVPWQFYPSGRRYRRHAPEPIPGLNGELGFGVPWLVKVSYQRHLLQVGFADRLLGELLARLRRLRIYDDAMVVVVADHGIAFHRGMERRTVTRRNVEDLAPVPLLVKLPGQRRSEIVDRHVETVDVLPTILEVAGVALPAQLDGRSLIDPVASRGRRVRVFHRVGTELNTVGGDYTFAVEGLERRRRAALRRKLALFGSGGGRNPEALYRIGPHAELVGRPAEAIARLPGVATARFDQAFELQRVDRASGFVPGEITGRVPYGRRGGGRPVALVLNGRIVAAGRTFSLAGSAVESFAMIVPERAFRRGPNEVQVYEVVRAAGRLALRPL
jgi:Sulfatase